MCCERDQIDVLLTDLRLGGEDGMTLIERALKLPHPPVCIMMTAYGSVDTAVEAMKRGAYDFVTKPLNLDKVEMLIARALGQPPARAGEPDAAPAGGRAISRSRTSSENRLRCAKCSTRSARSRRRRRTS